MAFHAVPHAIGVRIEGNGPDGMLAHVLHAKSVGTSPTVPELQAVADAVADWCIAHYRLYMSNKCVIQSVIAKDESVVDGAQVVGAGFLPTIGGQGGGCLPSNVTCCISLRTGFGGRAKRGRFYTWPASTDSIDVTGNWLQAYADPMVTNMNTLITALAALGTPLAVKSNVNTQCYPILTAMVVDYNTDSQRRRLKGRGR